MVAGLGEPKVLYQVRRDVSPALPIQGSVRHESHVELVVSGSQRIAQDAPWERMAKVGPARRARRGRFNREWRGVAWCLLRFEQSETCCGDRGAGPGCCAWATNATGTDRSVCLKKGRQSARVQYQVAPGPECRAAAVGLPTCGQHVLLACRHPPFEWVVPATAVVAAQLPVIGGWSPATTPVRLHQDIGASQAIARNGITSAPAASLSR